MGRRKTVSDEVLLDGLMPGIVRLGPAGLTFAAAAETVALAPATLVQRFGSRDAMVEAILLRAWDRLDDATDAADASAARDPEGAIALLLQLMPPDSAEFDMTDGLLLLREDVRNPRLRARGKAWGERLVSVLAPRLHHNPALGVPLAWQMLRAWQGALFWWAFTRHDAPERVLRSALEEWTQGLVVRG